MSDTVRVRFAPSPTGYLHVGGARTALFNYLFAKHTGGTFILRIEDTDRNRYQEDALREIFESLRWLGLDWDEGPEAGGAYGPYFQSERLSLYAECVEKLIKDGHAYRCFCTPERLAQIRKEQEDAKVPHVKGYDRRCRDLDPAEATRLLDKGMLHVVRLKIPDTTTIAFNDAIRGIIEYNSDTLDDLVLLKTDGFPTYHLANVVDDHHMGITHVLRGDEWIASTPRHVLLYQAFGWDLPVFAHLPVILAEGGGKLSKRKGAASVMDYKHAGYLPDALFNFLALLGWNPGDDREVMSTDDIASAFSLEKISPKSSVFDEKKLEWMNGQYMAKVDDNLLYTEVIDSWRNHDILGKSPLLSDRDYCMAVIRLMKSRSRKVTDLIDGTAYFFVDPAGYDEKAAKKHFKGNAVDILDDLTGKVEHVDTWNVQALEDVYRAYAEENELGGGKLIHPTRLAVSGVGFGAGLFEMMELLGKETVIRRMKKTVEYLRAR